MEKHHELQYNVAKLQVEHRDMELIIEEERSKPAPDQLLIQRYKKRKLQIKEQLLKLESERFPDIIA